MEQTFIGSIISANLSQLGNITYGFVGLETVDHQSLKVKISAFTKFESLNIGERVKVIGEYQERDKLIVAKTVIRLQ